MTNSAYREWLMTPGDIVDQLRNFSHSQTGIESHPHRCRSGVTLFTGQCDLQPLKTLTVCYHADQFVLFFEDRPLFNVKLKKRFHLARPDRFFTTPAYTL